jgi:hypothetical protein
MRKLLVLMVAAVLAISLGGVGIKSAAPSGSGTHASQRAQALKARALFNKYMSSHAPLIRAKSSTSAGAAQAQGAASRHVAASNGVQPFGSINWGGYADIEAGSDPATGVSADWTIPKVTCPDGKYRTQDAFDSQWVGLDGASDDTVEQLGSGEQCYEGVLYYYVWYEMFPNGTVQEGTQACINRNKDCPRPGDRISASVSATPAGSGANDYTLALKDHTTKGNDFSVTQPCDTDTCLDQSAEWIIERPAFEVAGGFQILPLAYYGTNTFTNGTVTSGGVTTSIAGFTGGSVNDVFTLDDSLGYYLQCVGQHGPPGQLLLFGDPKACPTVAPTHGGDSFSDTWDSSF